MTAPNDPQFTPDGFDFGVDGPSSGGSGPAGHGASGFEAIFEGSAWSEGLSSSQLALQQDLSCLEDGELDEPAAARAMVLLEESEDARKYFEDIRRFARFHRDMSDPDRLEARIAMLGSVEIARAAENIDLGHRLATIFYQLGKAYTLSAIEPSEFMDRVFEAAVPVEPTKTRGRGFVDGVIANRPSDSVDDVIASESVNWREARHLLNGRLERIADPLEKGKRLLEQAMEIDPSHEESKIYLAFVFGREGKTLRASVLYRDVFDTAMSPENRGHAAMQLGCMHSVEGDIREALILWRWVTISGLASAEPRFNLVRFNIGLAYVRQGQYERGLGWFRQLLDQHLSRTDDVSEVSELFVNNPLARELFESRDGFLELLVERLPELFVAHGSAPTSDSDPSSIDS